MYRYTYIYIYTYTHMQRGPENLNGGEEPRTSQHITYCSLGSSSSQALAQAASQAGFAKLIAFCRHPSISPIPLKAYRWIQVVRSAR